MEENRMRASGAKQEESQLAERRLERRPMSHVISTFLAENIASGAIGTGRTLRENAVAKLFSVGRMPAATALKRLESENLVHRRSGTHGVVVGQNRTSPPIDADLDDLKTSLPIDLEADLQVRNWRTLIYPVVEREVASCLQFGRYRIRSNALAEHFGVSRTVANELLVRLERVGAVTQESNSHWFAGQLSASKIRELYQMRIILEPAALREAAPFLERGDLEDKLRRVVSARNAAARSDVTLLHRIELDLHQDVVLRCQNEELRSTLYRCQLPLITSHLSFSSYGEDLETPVMLGSHARVLQHLIDNDIENAIAALMQHLMQSMNDSPVRLAKLRPLDRSALSAYIDPV